MTEVIGRPGIVLLAAASPEVKRPGVRVCPQKAGMVLMSDESTSDYGFKLAKVPFAATQS